MTVGIDIGTSNASAAFVHRGDIRLIPDRRGDVFSPSVAGIDRHGLWVVGTAAETVTVVKEELGRRKTIGRGSITMSPEEIGGLVLRNVRTYAEDYLDSSIERAILTVPATFNERQRNALMEAAILGGLTRPTLLDEPTAAVLSVGDGIGEGVIAVVDFGGGTLDVSCIEKVGDEYIVHAARSDGQMGGRQIDRLLRETLLSRIDHGEGLFSTDPVFRTRFMHVVERIKIELSHREHVSATIPTGRIQEQHAPVVLDFSRRELESLLEPMLTYAKKNIVETIVEAGYGRRGVDTLILAGGSCNIPAVRHGIGRELDIEPLSGFSPEEIVVRGAAKYGVRAGRERERTRTLLPATLSIELSDGSCVPVLPQNHTIPAAVTRSFTTVRDDQEEAEVHLVQGEAKTASQNHSLGRMTLSTDSVTEQGEVRIAVTIAVNHDGIITVTARNATSGVRRRFTTRSQPGVTRRAVEGDPEAYRRSLLRRLSTLTGYTGGTLRREIEDTVHFLGHQDTEHAMSDDHVLTVMESLISEVVAEQMGKSAGGNRRAAS